MSIQTGAAAANISAAQRAQHMLQSLSQGLADQERAFEQAARTPISRPIKNVLENINLLGDQIAPLRRVLPALEQGERLQQDIVTLNAISNAHQKLAGRVQDQLNAIQNSSRFAVEGREDLRLPMPLHARIAAFVGPDCRAANTLCRDLVAPARLPILNFGFPMARGFELVASRTDFDRNRCISAFAATEGRERECLTRCLWEAMEKPNPEAFDAMSAVKNASEAQIKGCAFLSRVQRVLCQFHDATKTFDFSNSKDPESGAKGDAAAAKNLINMERTFRCKREVGDSARKYMQEAVWVLHGFTDGSGKRVTQRAMTIHNVGLERFGHAVYVASYRLAKNSLALFKSHDDRRAIAMFVNGLQKVRRRQSSNNLQTLYRDLQAQSKDAAKLLAFAVGYAFTQNPSSGENCILNAGQEKQIEQIFEIAKHLSIFDNGRERYDYVPGVDNDVPVDLIL